MDDAALRLTCPNCGATYALAEAAMPPGGSHVQCGACHTRWFARPEALAAEDLSEDEILVRLETRAGRPRLAGGTEVPDPAAAPNPVLSASREQAAPAAAAPDGAARAGAAAAPVRAAAPQRIRAAPAQAETPPGEANSAGSPYAGRAAAATPLRPRQTAERALPAGASTAPAARSRVGFVPGLLLPLALAAAGLGVYLRAEDLQARAPAAGPALTAYVASVDGARGWIEARLGPLRDSLGG